MSELPPDRPTVEQLVALLSEQMVEIQRGQLAINGAHADMLKNHFGLILALVFAMVKSSDIDAEAFARHLRALAGAAESKGNKTHAESLRVMADGAVRAGG